VSAARPIVWSIAGSDSGGGAGIQADLKAFEAFGVHGCTAVSAITAQNSVAVRAVEAVSPDLLDAQLAALAADLPPAAIKTGMLGHADNVAVLTRWVDRLRQAWPGLALVVDPVLRSTTGTSFADDALVDAYRRELLPRATLVTPNRREAAALLRVAGLEHRADVEAAARALREAGAAAVAITGGDAGSPFSEDCIATPHASGWLRLPRLHTRHHHGTGCVFASSAAAALALGFVVADALVVAKMATTQALRDGDAAGAGAGPVRPSAGFALHAANLPELDAPGGALHFAPLSESRLGLYAVVDSAHWVERVLAGGVRTVQLRVKDPAHPGLRDEVRRSIEAAKAAGAQLFINDHWRIAIEEGAYGVHLGQEDLATADLPAIARAGLRLGVSTHSYWEVCRAWALRPSYIACGPIHATAAKTMPWIPQGEANLAYWCRLLPVPVVGIGGMDVARARRAAACGAAGVAVIGAITAAASPEQAMAGLIDAVHPATENSKYRAPALPQSTLR
jgi:hydroxymethylpyrimidine kinase/phosphomethylpyrimidine kinase/thiamine-phosphate diphosphorylase